MEEPLLKEFVKAAKTTDLSEDGDMMVVEVADVIVMIARVDGEYYAVDDACTHAGVSLADGSLEGDEVECPAHSSIFNVKTGGVTGSPADEPLQIYGIKLEGEDILVGPPG